MDQIQTTGEHATFGLSSPAVKDAYATWMELNSSVTRMCVDVGMAQFKGLQQLMAGNFLPGLITASTAGADKKLGAELGRFEAQVAEGVKIGRQIADDTRRSAFELAQLMLQTPMIAFAPRDAASH